LSVRSHVILQVFINTQLGLTICAFFETKMLINMARALWFKIVMCKKWVSVTSSKTRIRP